MICADGTMIELVEPQRYESQKQAIRGRVELVGPGMVLLVWDNSFSWLNTKQLAYSVELTQETPEASEERKTALAQHARVERERALLAKDMELGRLQTTIAAQEQTIEFIKHQIEELKLKLAKSEDEKAALETLRDGVEEQIDTLVWEIDGACAEWGVLVMILLLTDAISSDSSKLESAGQADRPWHVCLLGREGSDGMVRVYATLAVYPRTRPLTRLLGWIVLPCRSLASKSWAAKVQEFRAASQDPQHDLEAREVAL